MSFAAEHTASLKSRPCVTSTSSFEYTCRAVQEDALMQLARALPPVILPLHPALRCLRCGQCRPHHHIAAAEVT